MPHEVDPWVILRIRYHGPYAVITCRDDLSGRAEVTLPSLFGLSTVAWPASSGGFLAPQFVSESRFNFGGIIDMVAGAVSRCPWRPGSAEPTPLALYLKVPRGLEALDLENLLIPFFAAWATRVQFLHLTSGRWLRRSSFRLPLRIGLVGELASASTRELTAAKWLELENASTYGIVFEQPSESQAIARMVLKEYFDVLVVESSKILANLEEVPRLNRPRLLVVVGESRPIARLLKSGMAVLFVPPMGAAGGVTGAFIRDLFYGIIHDQPLHAALKSALLVVSNVAKPLLFADPISNQYVRLMHAAAGIRRESVRLDSAYRAGGLIDFIRRVSGDNDVIGSVLQSVESVLPAVESITKIASQGRDVSRDFSAETRGLVPLAQMEARLAALRQDTPGIDERLRELASYPPLLAILRQHQRRSVDVALERVESSPSLESVEPSTTLAANLVYRLRVHIGQTLQDSIVRGDVPAIDPLLPDPVDVKGHKLDVVVQGKDFKVLSRQIKKIYLPLIGGSDPVYFRIRAPRTTGPAQLRILVFHTNHCVQTFLLNARVTSDEGYQAEALRVELEFSRTDRFDNLDALHPRALSIGVNLGDATHQLTIKSQNAFGELRLPIEAVDNDVKEFRKVLDVAMRSPSNPNVQRQWPVQPSPLVTSGDLADVLRDLAVRGRKLYDGLFARASLSDPSLRKGLVRVRNSSDERLQILRMDFGFVFPWTFLYDYDLPDESIGEPKGSVCLGIESDGTGTPVRCQHTSTSPIYCVNGFWGIRHSVEEFLAKGKSTGPQVTRPSLAGAIRVVANAAIPQSGSLIAGLRKSIGHEEVADGPLTDAALIELLWKSPPERPLILIVLGHMAEDDRIVLVDNTEWLTHTKIATRAAHDEAPWGEPRSIVLLMACESANTTGKTINSFLTALQTAGAAAIVGTEAIVGSELASTFAQEVTLALWNRRTLGAAVTDFRRRTVSSGNPLGFVFNSLGDVDLTVGHT